MSTTQTNISLLYFYHYQRRKKLCYLADIFTGRCLMEQEYKQMLVRFRAETKDLLDAAARDQRRSRTSIIEELVIESLRPKYSSTETRLQQLLGAR
jgi:hypothetical protein